MPHLFYLVLWFCCEPFCYNTCIEIKKRANVATDSERGDCCESNCSTNITFRASWRGCLSISCYRLTTDSFALKTTLPLWKGGFLYAVAQGLHEATPAECPDI